MPDKNRGLGIFPNKQNPRPGRGGRVRDLPEVWLHFLCLLFLVFVPPFNAIVDVFPAGIG